MLHQADIGEYLSMGDGLQGFLGGFGKWVCVVLVISFLILGNIRLCFMWDFDY